MLKKLDFYGQITIIAIAFLSVIAALFQGGYFFLSLFLLVPLGIWQVISAACYSFASGIHDNKEILKKYWLGGIACLILFFGSFLLRDNEGNVASLAVMITAMSGSFLAALYYLYLYKKYFLHAKPAEKNSGIGGIG